MEDSLWLAVSDPEVKANPGDEHVGLESDFVHAGRGQRDGQRHHAQDGRGRRDAALASVRQVVLPAQTTQYQYHLQQIRVTFLGRLNIDGFD